MFSLTVSAREIMWHFIMFRENIFHISLKQKKISSYYLTHFKYNSENLKIICVELYRIFANLRRIRLYLIFRYLIFRQNNCMFVILTILNCYMLLFLLSKHIRLTCKNFHFLSFQIKHV
jgi:hypothetical protein